MALSNNGKFLVLDSSNGRLGEVNAIASSAGAGDADKIVKLNGSGKIDSTMVEQVDGNDYEIEASENLAQGDLVNIFNSSGLKARKADATDNTKPANGFAKEAITSGQTGTIHIGNGSLTKTSHGFTVAADLFLATTAGAMTETPPSSAGNLVQLVGKAIDTNTIAFVESILGGVTKG